MSKKLTIAVDGFSSCGKSTLAKDLAKKLGYVFIDSGAMYRGIALYALEHQFIQDGNLQVTNIVAALPTIKLTFKFNDVEQRSHLYLNDKHVEDAIRSPEVAAVVSEVATIKEVREFLVSKQREMGKEGGVIMDGRDIGTVVFPDADLKLFVTADPQVRAERRYLELQSKGVETSLEEVLKNLTERDRIDTTRKESPLVKATDAFELDTTFLNPTEQTQFVYTQWIKPLLQ